MRIKLFLVVILVFLLAVLAFAADKKPLSSCVQKCEDAKKSCMAQYTKSDSASGKYVTPEGHKICWNGYHECKKNCPKDGK